MQRPREFPGPFYLSTQEYTVEATVVKPQPSAPIPEGIPKKLKRRPQWVVWKLELRGEMWTKVPYTPGKDTTASSTDLMTWRTFPEALTAYEDGDYDGIGFMFSSADPYTGVDLDHVRDPETGEIEPWAQKIIGRFEGAYVEASPSGEGIHIICRGALEECMKAGPIELYSMRRYFTVTGHTL
jgi:putative DNA primase/helicase